MVAIFSNVETILDIHQTLYREIVHMRETYFPFVHGLGTLFLKHAAEFKCYGDYAENYVASHTALVNLSQKKHHLRDVIDVGC